FPSLIISRAFATAPGPIALPVSLRAACWMRLALKVESRPCALMMSPQVGYAPPTTCSSVSFSMVSLCFVIRGLSVRGLFDPVCAPHGPGAGVGIGPQLLDTMSVVWLISPRYCGYSAGHLARGIALRAGLHSRDHAGPYIDTIAACGRCSCFCAHADA